MRLAFEPEGWDDYQHWQRKDRKILKRVNLLIADTLRSPFDGVGKPEPLKHWEGAWSRRITDEHRLVYLPKDEEIIILQARYHY